MFPVGPDIEVELIGDLLLHFDKVGQEQDDFHLVVGQVSSAADALSPLDVRPTQENHSGPLVDILWSEPGDNPLISQSDIRYETWPYNTITFKMTVGYENTARN